MGRTVVGAKYPGQHEESRAGIRRHRTGEFRRAFRLRMIAGSEGQLREDKPSVRGLAIKACAPVGQCPGKLRLPGIQGGPRGHFEHWCIQRIIGGEFGHGRGAICRLGALEDARLDSTQVPGPRHQCCAITRRHCRPEQSLKSSGFHRVIHRTQSSTGAIHFSRRGQRQNEFPPDFDGSRGSLERGAECQGRRIPPAIEQSRPTGGKMPGRAWGMGRHQLVGKVPGHRGIADRKISLQRLKVRPVPPKSVKLFPGDQVERRQEIRRIRSAEIPGQFVEPN